MDPTAADPRSITDLFRAEHARLVRALALSFGTEVAAEAAQEAFLQADRHWRRISTYEDPALWVRRVAVNRARNQRRGAGRRRAALDRQAALAAVVERTAGELTDELLDLRAGIAALPERMRLAFTLHHLAGLRVDDVAAALEVSPGTVKSALHDARTKLQAHLAEDRHV